MPISRTQFDTLVVSENLSKNLQEVIDSALPTLKVGDICGIRVVQDVFLPKDTWVMLHNGEVIAGYYPKDTKDAG